MNRSIDKIVKQAKRAGRKVVKRREAADAPTLAKVCAKHQESKQTPQIRVWGPYQEGETKFRLKVAEGGVERSLVFRTLEEVEKVKEELLRKYVRSVRRTIGEALAEHEAWIVDVIGNSLSTKQCFQRMGRWLPKNVVMGLFSIEDARKLYQEQVDRVSPHTGRRLSPATHHMFHRIALRFWNWAIEQGYCRSNPWLKVTPIGRKPSGKPQLRIDEARRLEEVALRKAQEGDSAALGVLLMIYLGLRQGELSARVGRDIDESLSAGRRSGGRAAQLAWSACNARTRRWGDSRCGGEGAGTHLVRDDRAVLRDPIERGQQPIQPRG